MFRARETKGFCQVWHFLIVCAQLWVYSLKYGYLFDLWVDWIAVTCTHFLYLTFVFGFDLFIILCAYVWVYCIVVDRGRYSPRPEEIRFTGIGVTNSLHQPGAGAGTQLWSSVRAALLWAEPFLQPYKLLAA